METELGNELLLLKKANMAVRDAIESIEDHIYDLEEEQAYQWAELENEFAEFYGTMNKLDDLVADLEFDRKVGMDTILRTLYDCQKYFDQRKTFHSACRS